MPLMFGCWQAVAAAAVLAATPRDPKAKVIFAPIEQV